MAKAAKKETILTPEEKLEQAIVPDIEQPYKIPANWCWTYIGTGFFVTSSKRVHKSDWLSAGIPFYRTRELVKLSEYGFVDNELFIAQKLYEKFRIEYGVPSIDDLLISGVGTIGVPYIIKNNDPFYFKDGNIVWFKNKGLFLSKYVYYMYKSIFMHSQIQNMSAGTTVDTYTIENAERTMMPLPPPAEQQRIVDRIESLFTKLDETKEKAQAVVDGFEDRKAAILHKAFSGDLVKQHNDLSHKWEKVFLRDVVSGFKYGTSEKSDYSFTGMPVLRIPNIGEDGIDFSDIKNLTTEHIDAESQIHENDILIIRSNGSRDLVGKCAIVPSLDQEYAYASFLIRIKPSEKIRADYLALYLNSREARNQMSIKAKSSAGIHNINSKELGSIVVRLPSLNEQKEIVIAIQKLMQPEKQANELALEIIDQINSMKKAILARAFRGELGTNDPNDESAMELLKKSCE